MKMSSIKLVGIMMIAVIGISCSVSKDPAKEMTFEIEGEPTNEVTLSTELVWEMLNPARGNKSPLAATVWGDRKGEVATGFLVRFVDGFSSPPHIHNVSYRAVVLDGLVHNDDPDAANMWMPKGSFWTQPAGESHITSAQGEVNIAYVEIDAGPYLVKSVDESFDNGERPVNKDVSNLVWLTGESVNWIEAASNVAVSFLWEKNETQGMFLKVPAGFEGKIFSIGNEFRAIVIDGALDYSLPGDEKSNELNPGSCFSSLNKAIHSIANTTEKEVLLYLKMDGEIYVKG